MKIAYLITVYGQFEHLARLLSALEDNNVTFFIHIDKKTKIPKNIVWTKKTLLIKRIKVWWGGWSHQQAIINLMKEASKNNYDYYVLISGTDYPIRPNTFLNTLLNEGGEYIDLEKGFKSHKPESRIRYYYFDCFNRRNINSLRTKFFSLLEALGQKFIDKKKYPFKEVFHGSTWWALSNDCITFLLTFIKYNTKYVTFYKTCWCPEESFIHTILGNSKYLKKCKYNLTYLDWSPITQPAFIKKDHIQQFKKQSEFVWGSRKYIPFFARKFNDKSKDIVDQIDKELRI